MKESTSLEIVTTSPGPEGLKELTHGEGPSSVADWEAVVICPDRNAQNPVKELEYRGCFWLFGGVGGREEGVYHIYNIQIYIYIFII